MRSNVCIGVAAVLAVVLGGVASGRAHAAEPLPVSVSIAPQKYFVEKIGGGLVKVAVMVEPGANPHVYEPKPQQMVDLAKSKIYFAIGDEFEDAWLGKLSASNPGMRIVRTDAGIIKPPMGAHHHHDEEEHEEGHAHHDGDDHHPGHEGEHHHEGGDPHIWLSPPMVMMQARSMASALIDADPVNITAYQENYKKFIDEIAALDMELKGTFQGGGQREFMVFHPSWGCFAQAYGLTQTPVEVEGKEPKAAELKELIDHAKEHGVKVVFVQPQFSEKSARMIADSIGGQVVAADPLSADWAANLREVGAKFKEALK